MFKALAVGLTLQVAFTGWMLDMEVGSIATLTILFICALMVGFCAGREGYVRGTK